MRIVLLLPFSPSANHLYTVSRRRKILSKKGREYQAAVRAAVEAQGSPRMPPGRLAVTIDVYPPDRRRRDIANHEKAVIDAVRLAGVIEDDGLIDFLTVRRREVVRGGQLVLTLATLGQSAGQA